MSDDLTNNGLGDTARINLKQDWEVKYWTKTLACSVMELIAAVRAVGNSSKKVKEYLLGK